MSEESGKRRNGCLSGFVPLIVFGVLSFTFTRSPFLFVGAIILFFILSMSASSTKELKRKQNPANLAENRHEVARKAMEKRQETYDARLGRDFEEVFHDSEALPHYSSDIEYTLDSRGYQIHSDHLHNPNYQVSEFQRAYENSKENDKDFDPWDVSGEKPPWEL